MCGTSASADRLLVVHEARVAADELVGSIEAESERQAGIDRARAYANLEPIA